MRAAPPPFTLTAAARATARPAARILRLDAPTRRRLADDGVRGGDVDRERDNPRPDLERVRGGSPAQGQAVPDPAPARRNLIGSLDLRFPLWEAPIRGGPRDGIDAQLCGHH